MTKQQLKESLNKLDHKALDECTKYYDLVALYESAKFEMSNNDFSKLESLIKESNSEKINNFMLNLLQEDFVYEEAGKKDNSELNLDRIFESEMLAEDKIVPEKCYAKESGKPYYSLKNITDDEYIQYGARTRYNSRARAEEKLRDLQAHVDGEYIDDSNVIKSDKKTNESLNESDIDDSYITYKFGNKILSEQELNKLPDINCFIKSPFKKNGLLFDQVKPIILLYKHVYMDGEDSVPVDVLLREAGVPSPERRNAAGTWRLEYKILDLMYTENDKFYPGKNLKDWVEGNKQVICMRHHRAKKDKYTNEVIEPEWYESIGEGTGQTDLRPYIKSNYKQRESQGLQPDRSHGKGDTVNQSSNAATIKAQTKYNVKDDDNEQDKNNENIVSFNWDLFGESLSNYKENHVKQYFDMNNTNDKRIVTTFNRNKDNNTLNELKKSRRDKMRSKWKKFQDLDEDADIDFNKFFNDDDFRHFCSMNGYSYEKDKDLFLSED